MIKRMDIKEFREEGFLQEANRQFFHKHGLALEVLVHDDGTVTLGGIWDYREDPEGMVFGPGVIEREKYENVMAEQDRHRMKRNELFMGRGDVQPLDDEAVDWELVESRSKET